MASSDYGDVTESWFSPEFWGKRAKPVTTGGRGGAWFIDSEATGMVLRHYKRGGQMAHLSEKSYLFTGFETTRSLAEFRLLTHLHNLGLPVPDAVAAIAWRYRLLWYRAAIIVKRVPGAVTFPDSERASDASLWEALGRVIRRFHDVGLDHVDLNCDNILVTESQLYLIDFDRCRLLSGADNKDNSAWKRKNLERLKRSVTKRFSSLNPAELQAYWNSLLAGYRPPWGSHI